MYLRLFIQKITAVVVVVGRSKSKVKLKIVVVSCAVIGKACEYILYFEQEVLVDKVCSIELSSFCTNCNVCEYISSYFEQEVLWIYCWLIRNVIFYHEVSESSRRDGVAVRAPSSQSVKLGCISQS